MRALFYPDKVAWFHTLRGVFKTYGWETTNNLYAEFDFAIAWNDKPKLEVYLDQRSQRIFHYLKCAGYPVYNSGIRSTNRDAVEACHVMAFGYGAHVDPLTWTGKLVEKSAWNYGKDSRLLKGPLRSDQVLPDRIYMKEIDNRNPDNEYIDFRTTIVDRRPVWAQQFWYYGHRRFKKQHMSYNYRSSLPEEVFTAKEIEQIHSFCTLFGMDFGDLDILRDVQDGHIYVVDANPTTGGNDTLEASLQDLFPGLDPDNWTHVAVKKRHAFYRSLEPFRRMVEQHLVISATNRQSD